MKIKVSKEAAAELEEAVAWYEEEEAGLGVRLIDAFQHALQLLRAALDRIVIEQRAITATKKYAER